MLCTVSSLRHDLGAVVFTPSIFRPVIHFKANHRNIFRKPCADENEPGQTFDYDPSIHDLSAVTPPPSLYHPAVCNHESVSPLPSPCHPKRVKSQPAASPPQKLSWMEKRIRASKVRVNHWFENYYYVNTGQTDTVTCMPSPEPPVVLTNEHTPVSSTISRCVPVQALPPTAPRKKLSWMEKKSLESKERVNYWLDEYYYHSPTKPCATNHTPSSSSTVSASPTTRSPNALTHRPSLAPTPPTTDPRTRFYRVHAEAQAWNETSNRWMNEHSNVSTIPKSPLPCRTVPCLVQQASDSEVRATKLITNIQASIVRGKQAAEEARRFLDNWHHVHSS
ncbi:hypothetical protein IWQ62_006086 [Dispira parvispora]|uniref:Uncharacterized protein n=1 Tax=Dispira parvispora TaxID=1520584 RepID=A0A9W8AHE4_9FUNG|nr:hypothetical protein IWQ62_006086 [Dispira parvispora]